jgi:hypothetical protein
VPVAFDTTGMERHDERTWFDPRTGDQVSLTYIGMVPDLPASLDDLPLLRHRLTEETAEVGSIIEAHVVQLDGVPAVLQLIKLPIPNQETGLAFIAAFTVPRANCSAVLRIQCAEGPTTGAREAAVATQVGFENCFPPHPYAQDVRGRLPFHVADEAGWDQHFPDHPLTRARAWAHRMLATARVDPQFVALPPFEPAAPPVAPAVEPPAEAGDVLHTVLVGLPIGDYLPLWQESGVTFWRMADPAAVRARLGSGTESRTEIDSRRFREAAMLSQDRGTLFLMDRHRDDGGQLGGTSTQLTRATEEEAYGAVDDKALSELYAWLGEVVLAAVGRGEFVAIESGGWQVPMKPVVLVMLRTDGREWHSVVETSPVPVGAPVWRDQQPVDGDTQVLASPATDQTVRASGLLTRFAVATWQMHPFQLGLSFGPNPTLEQR